MNNYTNILVNLLLYRGPATTEELAEFKPELAKSVICAAGMKTIIAYVRTKFDHHKYWAYTCTVCGKTGIKRAGSINSFRCECQKNVKRPRKQRRKKIQPKEKMCQRCKQILPLTTDYYYRAKTGYFGSYCKDCHKGRYVSDREFGQLI